MPTDAPSRRLVFPELVPETDEEREFLSKLDPDLIGNAIQQVTMGGGGNGESKLSRVRRASREEVLALVQELEPNNELHRLLLIVLSRDNRNVNAQQRNDGGAGEEDEVKFQDRILGHLPLARQLQVMEEMDMDTMQLWEDLPRDILNELERDGLNPLNNNCSTRGANRLIIPDHEERYGGFTADIGWVIRNGMFALETANCIEFSRKWGHGCDVDESGGGWTCMFKPIQARPPSELEKWHLRSGEQKERRMVRRDHLYEADSTAHRYPRLQSLIQQTGKTFVLQPKADLLAWRLVFRWMFQVNDKVRRRIDEIHESVLRGFVPEKIAAAHLRFGDKFGLKPGPREGRFEYQVRDFAERLVLYYKKRQIPFPRALFVATDDYSAAQALSKLFGNRVVVLTSAKPLENTGFSIVEYRAKSNSSERFEASVRLWADMEILARADVFLGSFQSNVGRTVQLMRFGKPASSTISVDPFARCSKHNKARQLQSHNFWYCA